MFIAAVSLNAISAGILNRQVAAFGGLTLGSVTATPAPRVGQSAVANTGRDAIDSRPPTDASLGNARNVLNDVGQSLTDLRSALSSADPHSSPSRNIVTPKFADVQRSIDQDVFAQQTVYRQQDVFEDRDRFEAQDVYENRDVFETRDVVATRDVFEARDVFETRDVFESRDVYQTQNVYETRDVYETRPVYGQQAVYETDVNGTRDLSSFNSLSAAGIDTGADLSIQVGSGAAAKIKFASSTQIAVTTNGTTVQFNFSANDGTFRTALKNALNSISGLSASYSANGKLQLKTSGAQSLTINDVANQVLDFSRSPLAPLGLAAGTANAAIIGYNTVQTGTEQVKTGTEQVVVGTQQVKIGTQQVKVGTEQVKVGTEQVKIGTEQYVAGTEQVKVGTEAVLTGTRQVKVGIDHVKVGTERVVDGVRNIKIGTKQVDAGRQRVFVGFETGVSDEPVTARSQPGLYATTIDQIKTRLASQIASPAFKSLDEFFAKRPGNDASRQALNTIENLDVKGFAADMSRSAVVDTIKAIESASTAVDQLKAGLAASSDVRTSLTSGGLLPILALSASGPANDSVSLLARAVRAYGEASQPSQALFANLASSGLQVRSLI